jgi:hypothetical protein
MQHHQLSRYLPIYQLIGHAMRMQDVPVDFQRAISQWTPRASPQPTVATPIDFRPKPLFIHFLRAHMKVSNLYSLCNLSLSRIR